MISIRSFFKENIADFQELVEFFDDNHVRCDFSGPFPHLVFTTIPPGRAL